MLPAVFEDVVDAVTGGGLAVLVGTLNCAVPVDVTPSRVSGPMVIDSCPPVATVAATVADPALNVMLLIVWEAAWPDPTVSASPPPLARVRSLVLGRRSTVSAPAV